MDNILSSLVDEISEEIVKKRVQDSQQEIEDKSEEITNENAKEKYKQAISDAKEKAKEAVDSAIDEANEQAGEFIRQVKSDLNDLGTSAGLLAVGTAQFAARIAMIPPAIISATPLGPGVSAQLVPPMLQDLKAEGDQLSRVYDECNYKMNKLGLTALVGSIPSISGVISLIKTTQSVAKPLIAMIGSNVDDMTGSLPEVDIPITITYEAEDCTNFSYIILPDPEDPSSGDISAENCSNFEPMTDQDSTVSCNNCKKYNKRV